MPRKPTEDQAARDAARQSILDKGLMPDSADSAMTAFRYAEFEVSQSRVAGETVKFARVVLTGPWEIVQEFPK